MEPSEASRENLKKMKKFPQVMKKYHSCTTYSIKRFIEWILYLFQIFGAAIICLGTFNPGALLGYTTIALPQWKNETNIDLRLDENESSLFASLFWMVGIICSPIGGILSGWLGRRKIIMIATPLVICGWLIIGFAQNKIMLYIGQIISGGMYPIIYICRKCKYKLTQSLKLNYRK